MSHKLFTVGVAVIMSYLTLSMPLTYAVEIGLSYDANGNLVSGDGKFRVYNSLNQLYRVYNGSSTNGTLLYEFKYHPIEERVLVKKTYNASGNLTETVYYWNNNFITVVNASGSFNYTYVYHNGDLIAQQNPDGSKLFVMGDNKGSTSVVTNGSGTVLERTAYSPTGEVLSGGRLNRFGYEGKEQELGFGKVPVNGLVSYYAFEGGAYDDGVGNQGTVFNATLTSGKIRDAYSFNGNGSYIQVNDSASLDLSGNITVSVWVYPASSTQGYIVCKYGSYMIQFLATNQTQGGIWSGGSWKAFVTASTSQNTWTHVVFTYDQVNAKLYINGALLTNFSNSSAIDITSHDFFIGARNATYRSRDFNGSMDEVGVWNRALTATEVSQLYQYGNQFDSGFRSTDFEFRQYDSNTELFEQPDTLISNVYDPQSLNRYMFERGSPASRIDKGGHAWQFAVAGLIGAAINTGIYFSTHETYTWKGALSYATGGAIAGALTVTGVGGAIGGSAFSRAIERWGDGKSLTNSEAFVEYGVAGASGGIIAGAGTEFLPQPNKWILGRMKPSSFLTKKTGLLFTGNDLSEGAIYTFINPGQNYLSSIVNSFINNIVNLMHAEDSSNAVFGSRGGSGYSSAVGGYVTSSGRYYPTTNKGWKPNPNAQTVCVSGC